MLCQLVKLLMSLLRLPKHPQGTGLGGFLVLVQRITHCLERVPEDGGKLIFVLTPKSNTTMRRT